MHSTATQVPLSGHSMTFQKLKYINHTQVSLDGSNCQGVPTELSMIFSHQLNLAAYAPPVVAASMLTYDK